MMGTQIDANVIMDIFTHRDLAHDSSTMSSDIEPPKKKRQRARLDHLTAEEKRERRKEKNRQAAQTARDRKRDNMDRLKAENEKLRAQLRLARELLAKHQIIPQSQGKAVSSNTPPCYISDVPPQVHITNHDSGVSDTGTISKASSQNLACGDQQNLDHLTVSQSRLRIASNSPDSLMTYKAQENNSVTSPAPTEEDELIDSFLCQQNEQELIDEAHKVVNYIDKDLTCPDVLVGSAVSIKYSLPQVQGTSRKPHQSSIVNSLGWTTIQLMLIILISRIHHQLSARINCCPREPEKQKSLPCDGSYNNVGHERSMFPKEPPPILSNIKNISTVDYILNTRCSHFREVVEGIISSKEILSQRRIAIEFVNKYLGSKLR